MKVLWICGLPNEVRLNGWCKPLSPLSTPAWSWILGHLPPEGVELHFLCQVVGLAKPRIDFDYLGAHWHCFRRKRFIHFLSYVWHMIACRRFVKKLHPDIIHGWGGETGFGCFATKYKGRSVVSVQGQLRMLVAQSKSMSMTMHGWRGQYLMLREQYAYRHADLLITESVNSADSLKKRYGLGSVIVPQPLRAVFYKKVECERAESPMYLYVGTLVDRKGALDVVTAFARVADQNAKLIIIGEGAERGRVEKLIREKGLVNRVTLKSNCNAEDVAENMRRAHFFALPSYGDTGPNALKEALACGLFPICYDNSGPHEYITRYCGYLCETGNVEAYAELMNRALANREGCLQKSAGASIRIKEDLSKKMVWARLRELYKKVV